MMLSASNIITRQQASGPHQDPSRQFQFFRLRLAQALRRQKALHWAVKMKMRARAPGKAVRARKFWTWNSPSETKIEASAQMRAIGEGLKGEMGNGG